MNKIKGYLTNKGTNFLLGVILVIFLVLFMIVGEVIENKNDKQIYERQLEVLEELIDESGAEDRGLNRNTVIWVDEIERLRDNIPNEFTDFEKYGSLEEWYSGLNELINDINSRNISDEDIYQQIKDIMPDDLFHFATENYLKAIALLRRDLIK